MGYRAFFLILFLFNHVDAKSLNIAARVIESIHISPLSTSPSDSSSWRRAFESVINDSFLSESSANFLPKIKINIEISESVSNHQQSYDYNNSTIYLKVSKSNINLLESNEKKLLIRYFAHEFGHAVFHHYAINFLPDLENYFKQSASDRVRLAQIGRWIANPPKDIKIDGDAILRELDEITRRIQSSKKLDIYLTFHEFIADVIGTLITSDLNSNVFRPITEIEGAARSFKHPISEKLVDEWKNGLNIFNSLASGERHYGFGLARWRLGTHIEKLISGSPKKKIKVLTQMMSLTTEKIKYLYEEFSMWRKKNPNSRDIEFLKSIDMIALNEEFAQYLISKIKI